MKQKWLVIVLISLLGVAVFCLVATTLKIFAIGELPLNFVAVFLEAIITAVITVVLLTGQSAAEEIKERNVKVFEKKSEVVTDYIGILWKVAEDQKITMDEYDDLRKKYITCLSIYLKEKTNKSIAGCLRNLGEFVEASDDAYDNIKENIFSIINVLGEELNLGGKIDCKLDKELERPIFPMLFKKAILNNLNRSFEDNTELKGGKFCMEDDLISQSEYGGEYICFDFRKFKGCKLLIGSFSKYCPHAGWWLMLFIEQGIHGADEFRYNNEQEYRFCEFSKCIIPVHPAPPEKDDDNWVNLLTPHPENAEYMQLGDFEEPAEWMFLDEPETIENYRNNYQDVARTIGKRAAYWFNKGLIWLKGTKGGEFISIMDFLNQYIGNKKNIQEA